jgi:hypothetical protein
VYSQQRKKLYLNICHLTVSSPIVVIAKISPNPFDKFTDFKLSLNTKLNDGYLFDC